jgi:hypothetical protein
MNQDFEFIIHAIIKVSKTNRLEKLEQEKALTIAGTKKGFLKDERIEVIIERSVVDPNQAAFITAVINEKRKSADILKDILFDILQKTEMLDSKLKMKLDILLNDRKLRYENGILILE